MTPVTLEKFVSMSAQGVRDALQRVMAEAGLETEDLADAVHDAASEMASDINNDGMDAQIRFLLDDRGWTGADIISTARLAKEDADEEQRKDEKRGLYPGKQDHAN